MINTTRSDISVGDILTPISQKYCGEEYIRDTSDFLVQLADVNLDDDEDYFFFTLDVKGLYPSISPEFASQAILDACNTSSDLTDPEIQGFVYFAHYLIKNSVTHYRGSWYRTLEGIPTGGSGSRPIADCFMSFVLRNLMGSIVYNDYILWFKRFIDDIFGIFKGSISQFREFENQLNRLSNNYGIQLDKGVIGKSVDFLDVNVSIDSNNIIRTKIFRKPTDSRNYLHFYSYHNHHTFKGIVYSQMLRVIRLTSEANDQIIALEEMMDDFRRRGYPGNLLSYNREKVLNLDRNDLLQANGNRVNDNSTEEVAILSTKYSPFVNKFKEHFSVEHSNYNRIKGVRKTMHRGC